jgi:hypothetical protein
MVRLIPVAGLVYPFRIPGINGCQGDPGVNPEYEPMSGPSSG